MQPTLLLPYETCSTSIARRPRYVSGEDPMRSLGSEQKTFIFLNAKNGARSGFCTVINESFISKFCRCYYEQGQTNLIEIASETSTSLAE